MRVNKLEKSLCSILLVQILSYLYLISPVFGELRPFYNIAHMVNSIKEVSTYLDLGANALEADVTFSENGTAIYTYHGYPCDCFRHCTEKEQLTDYLDYIKDITTPSSSNYKEQLALLFLDLKVSQLPPSSKAVAGQELADKLIKHIFDDGVVNSKVKVLLSVGHIFDYDFVLGFQNQIENRDLNHLSDHIGWDVGLNDPIGIIEHMWRRIDGIKNIWQGDGRTNCLSPFYNLGRLTNAVRRRDEINFIRPEPYMAKVYHWTIDLTVNLRSSLRTMVDGVITNHPERVVNVLRETEFSKKFRLATQDDNPWSRVRARVDEVPSPTSPIMQPLGFRIANGVGDMFNSLTKYVKDFVFLRVPNYSGNGNSINNNNVQKARQLSEKLEFLELLVNLLRIRNMEKLKVETDKESNWRSG